MDDRAAKRGAVLISVQRTLGSTILVREEICHVQVTIPEVFSAGELVNLLNKTAPGRTRG
jgi:hypothetical protein